MALSGTNTSEMKSEIIVNTWHLVMRREGKKVYFIILVCIVAIIVISTDHYGPPLAAWRNLEWIHNQVKSEIVNGTKETSGFILEENGTSPSEFAHRLERVQQVCSSHPNLEGKVHGIFTHPSGIIYCFVPKAGCTFWKRIFNYAALKNKTEYSNPWSIPRWLVHSNDLRNGEKYKSALHSPTNFPMRFIVSRDPFSRLVSSYLDKLYLPDFWHSYGKTFSLNLTTFLERRPPDFMSRHFDSLQSLFGKNKTRQQQIQCGQRLTFAGFVASLVNKPETHWVPVHSLCNPCQFKPTHIIHIESFMSDSKVILQKMGLDKVVGNFTHNEQVNEEIQTIVDYNFQRLTTGYGSQHISACVTEKELAYRLWHNFVWRGYIHPQSNYTIPDSSTCVQNDLLKQIWRARIKGLQNKETMRKRAQKFKLDLYSTISKALFEGLRKVFELDFKFYGYSDSLEHVQFSN